MHSTHWPMRIPDEYRWVALEILKYVAYHSDARDTREGIQRWWLGERNVPEATVRSALEYLTSVGLLITKESTAGEATYGLNRTKIDEALKTLRDYRDTIQ